MIRLCSHRAVSHCMKGYQSRILTSIEYTTLTINSWRRLVLNWPWKWSEGCTKVEHSTRDGLSRRKRNYVVYRPTRLCSSLISTETSGAESAIFNLHSQSQTDRTNGKNQDDKTRGEWIVTACPDVKGVLENEKVVKQSLLKRIYVNSEQEADAYIKELKTLYSEYQLRYAEATAKTATLARAKAGAKSGQSLSALEFSDIKNAAKKAKADLSEVHEQLMSVSMLIPNVLASAANLLPTDNDLTSHKQYQGPPLCSSPHCLYTSPVTGLSYLTGKAAQLELELSHFVSMFMEEKGFTEVSVPSFVREDLLNIAGARSDELYKLQTKAQLHSENTSEYREAIASRKAKPEDDYVFCCMGLTDMSLMLLFMRSSCAPPGNSYNLFSVGTQYRMPYVGKPTQSKLAALLTVSATAKEAELSFRKLVRHAQSLYQALELAVTTNVIEPHNLAIHEAFAVEFVTQLPETRRTVLGRLAISYDYLSRRIMACEQTGSDGNVSRLHFVSGELIDISVLIEVLNKS